MSLSAGDGPRLSVLMPVYNARAFLPRALDSLLLQSFSRWELIAIDDASSDGSSSIITDVIPAERLRLVRLEINQGLGAALNVGLAHARAPLISYLPADDVIYADHLAHLVALLDSRPELVLVYSGVRHHYNRQAAGPPDGYSLQLVQVAHRAVDERWMERGECVTDDLGRMYWQRLGTHGKMAGTGRVSCEWVDHPDQLHKIIREPEGGINPYRQRFHVREPLRFHSTVGNRIDEVEHYAPFRERPEAPPSADGLTILLVGELAYNPERILALEERGHRLYGLWTPNPYWYNTVGPLPFGHVQDVPWEGWRDTVERLRPDVIYALLNWQAVPFAHDVLSRNPDVPFVWHFKEGPFICLEKGTWREMLELYERSDAQIFCSAEMRAWVDSVLPGSAQRPHVLVLDGDLPKREWFTRQRSQRLSERDGEIHTVVPGRPIGLHPETVGELAANGVHLHFYGDFTHGQWARWVERARSLAPGHLHLHANVGQRDWVQEFSQYDAGWLHYFQSKNEGDIRRADWDDLNLPARMSTLAAAGLPMLQRDNTGSVVATQAVARDHDLGLFFTGMDELAGQLRDERRMGEIRESVWGRRHSFTFDDHADRLIAFFRDVIESHI